MANKLNIKKLFNILIFLIAITSLLCKVFLGFDNDEQYTLSIAYRLLNNDSLISDIWDPYQLVAIFSYPIFKIWYLISGSLLNILLIERLVCLIIQILVAIFVYKVFKRYINNEYAYICSIIYLVLLPKQTLIFDHANGLNWFLTICILSLFLYLNDKKYRYLIISSISLAFAVISYPTQVFIFLIIELLILFVYKDKKAALIFMLPCFIMGLLFISYFLIIDGYKDFLYYVSMILKDGSHKSFDISRIIKNIGILILFFIGDLLFGVVASKIYSYIKKEDYSSTICINFMIILWPIAIIALFNFGYVVPPLSMYRRYFIISFIGFYLYKKYKKSNNELIFLVLPIAVSLICLISSNQGIDSASGFLTLSVAYSVCVLISNKEILFTRITIIALLISICLINCLSARVSGTGSYPTYKLVKSSDDINSVIYITSEDKDLFTEVSNLKDILKDKALLYAGEDPLCYMLTSSKIFAPQSTTTPIHDNQWVEYYKNKDALPEYILIDKKLYHQNDYFIYGELGSYLLNDDFSIIYESDRLTLLKLED